MALQFPFPGIAEEEKRIEESQRKLAMYRQDEVDAIEYLNQGQSILERLIASRLPENNMADYKAAIATIWDIKYSESSDGLLEEIQSLQNELSALDNTHQLLKNEKREIEERLKLLEISDVKSSELSNSEIQESNLQLRLKNSTIQELNLQLRLKNSKIQELEQLVDALGVSEEELSNYVNSNLVLEEEAQKHEAELISLRSAFQNIEEENKKLKSEKIQWQQEQKRKELVSSYPGNSDKEENKIKKLREEKEELAKKIKILSEKNENLISENYIFQRKSETKEVERKSLEIMLQKLQEDVNVLDKEKIEQIGKSATDGKRQWSVNDIVQIKGEPRVVKICGFPEDAKQGHYTVMMPDGETTKNYFTGQLKFIAAGDEDFPVHQVKVVAVDSQIPLDLGVKVTTPIVTDDEIATKIIKTYSFTKTTWQDFVTLSEKKPGVVKAILGASTKSGKNVKQDLPFKCAQYVVETGDTSDYDWIQSSTFEKLTEEAVGKLRQHQEEIDKVAKQEQVEQELLEIGEQFWAKYNSPKKIKQAIWESVRDFAQGDPRRIDAIMKAADAKAKKGKKKETTRTKFCDDLHFKLANYIQRTVTDENPQGDRSDLDWVPFKEATLDALKEKTAETEITGAKTAETKVELNAPLETADNQEKEEIILVNANPKESEEKMAEIEQVVAEPQKKPDNQEVLPWDDIEVVELNDRMSFDKLRELTELNPENIAGATNMAIATEITAEHVRRTADFDSINWLPEEMRKQAYAYLGVGTRPSEIEVGDKVRGSDQNSSYYVQNGIVTRLTPNLVTVAWGNGKFNTHEIKELELLPVAPTQHAA